MVHKTVLFVFAFVLISCGEKPEERESQTGDATVQDPAPIDSPKEPADQSEETQAKPRFPTYVFYESSSSAQGTFRGSFSLVIDPEKYEPPIKESSKFTLRDETEIDTDNPAWVVVPTFVKHQDGKDLWEFTVKSENLAHQGPVELPAAPVTVAFDGVTPVTIIGDENHKLVLGPEADSEANPE